MNPTLISGSTTGYATATMDRISGSRLMVDVPVSASWASEAMFVPASQAYFWTPAWQRAEAEADADIEAGRVERFTSMADAIAALNADDE